MRWSDPFQVIPSRFRIRVSRDEEFALPIGITLIGRDASCSVSLADSVASRRHARIECDGERAILEDLGSRNGTRINDMLICSPHTLRAGDRVGIGTSELVISVLEADVAAWREETTGVSCVCAQCRQCFPALARACPRCGLSPSPSARSEQIGADETSRARWSVAMLVEMVGKAILQKNAKDADKLMRRAALIAGDQLRAGSPLTLDELRALGEAARWIDAAHGDAAWSDWFERLRAQAPVL